MPGSTDQTRFAALVIAASLFGSAVAQPVSHDFNADGSEDFPVSLTGFESTDPVTGAARIWSGASKTVLDTFVAAGTNTLFGWSVGSAGDLNDDGFNDLIVGEPLWGQGGSLVGRFHVFSGDDASTLLAVEGPYLETALGRYVAGIADWNGDGTPDIAASGWDIADLDSDGIGDDPIGIVYIFSGADGSVLVEISDPAATAMFGYSIFGLGDITGDGFADIAIVDRHARATPQSVASGQVYLFTGRATPGVLTVSDAHRVLSNTDPAVRGYAAQVDVMHPDVWLSEPTLQIISLTTTDAEGGPNHAATRIDLVQTDGAGVGTKGERSSLVLAGDINLDGKVNALDLQASISQLGTNPQAMGVMPIADMNSDQVVDAFDVALLLQGYGSTTDIYEGLWDGSRLLAVVGGSAGFGSTAGANLSGVSHLEGGRRPIDDCLRGEIPPSQGPGLVPALLRGDARANCATCPGCDNQGICYDCNNAGQIQDANITATPDQPLIGETVTFEWTGFEVTGRQTKCVAVCGTEGTLCPVAMTVGTLDWEIERKNASGGWDVVKSRNGSNTPTWSGAACEEVRIRVTSGSLGVEDNCTSVESKVTVSDPVKFAAFRMKPFAFVEINGSRDRKKYGIGEQFLVNLEPAGAEAIWQIDGQPASSGPVSSQYVLAGDSAGSITVTATSGGCSRSLDFEIVEPKAVNYVGCDASVHHQQGTIDVGFYLVIDLDPDDVSFYRVEWRELGGGAEGRLGYWQEHVPPIHDANYGGPNDDGPGIDGNWIGVSHDNSSGIDHAYMSVSGAVFGQFYYDIPIEYRVIGSTVIHDLNEPIRQTLMYIGTCVRLLKGDMDESKCRDDDTLTGSSGDCP